MIDCDALLFGNPSWEQVVEFFKLGGFDSERYLVDAIKKHLRTETQRLYLASIDVSIEDILNGRVPNRFIQVSNAVKAEWNQKLGFNHFC